VLTLIGDGSFTYTPHADYNGSDSFTYKANDGTFDSNTVTVDISVTAVNDAPVAVADVYSTAADTTLTVAVKGVLANDTDADDDSLTAELTSGATHGTVALEADGSFVYVPTAGYTGTDVFTYRANDGTVNSNTVTVTITVGSPGDVLVVEVAGANRFATAIEASKKAFTTSEYVLIATGMNWPDALGGSALAGALDAPILLTRTNALPAEVIAEIERLGATEAIVLGGTSAVSAAVANAIGAIDLVSVERISGSNRYETAKKVAERAIAELKARGGYDGTAFVATGANFPDALGASPLAAAQGWPIYLANPLLGSNASLVATMGAEGVTKSLVLGGTNAVGGSVETALASLGSATRLSGGNRYETAIEIAKYGVANAGLGWNRVAFATGTNFPDALAGGVLQGKDGSVMLLTPGTALNASVAATLATNKAAIFEVRYLGSTSAVSQTVRDQVIAALE
jgi:VCBS repeat-containing protein